MRAGRRKGRELDAVRRSRARRALASADADPSFYVSPVGDAPVEGGLDVPDILHERPRPWGDLSGATELARFAFEGGDCAGVFDVVIDATPVSPSGFSPDSFAEQLYLDSLVSKCFPLVIDGTRHEVREKLLARILSAPPADVADATARQRVLRELTERPALRRDLERLYVGLRTLRHALEAGPGVEPSTVRRKLEVLTAARACVDALADGFEGTTSALSRLRAAGARIRANEAYARLVELLDFDDHMATVDVRLRLGADGMIRGFGVLAVRENDANSLLPGPVRRFFQRIASVLRGYRYGESEVVVLLLHHVFDPLVEDIVACLALTGSVELYLATLGFRDLSEKKGLAVCLPELVDPPRGADEVAVSRSMVKLYNPLLFLQNVVPIPCDIESARHDELTILTGPNSGGKTRLLQALALTQLLGQSGVFVPAEKACIVRAPSLFVSLVVESDAAQVEGRLGTELLRVRRLFEELEPGSLAILDELCSGTNPNEGEDIFEMVVSLLPRLRPQVFISTHFLGLAARLERERPTPHLAFLEVELDSDEQPTFGFVPGVAKTSLAHKLAARLGVTREELETLVETKLAR